MTIEEINILQDIVDIYEKEDMYPTLNDKQVRTIKKAIKTLNQEPCEAISRAYIEPIVEELENICINGDEHILSLLSNIKNAPPVTPQQEICNDAISRQAVLDMMQMRIGGKELYKAVYDMPPVTPHLRTGWVPTIERLPDSDGDYRVIEKSGRIGTYVFHKEGNSEEYWKRCTAAWMPLSESYNVESKD